MPKVYGTNVYIMGENIYPESKDKFIFINEAKITSHIDNYWGGLKCVILKIDTSKLISEPKEIGNNSYEYNGKIPFHQTKVIQKS